LPFCLAKAHEENHTGFALHRPGKAPNVAVEVNVERLNSLLGIAELNHPPSHLIARIPNVEQYLVFIRLWCIRRHRNKPPEDNIWGCGRHGSQSLIYCFVPLMAP